MLRAVVLAILCCVHAASGGTHSLRYFYTGTSGITEFPEYVSVGMVDDVQISYCDSKSKRDIPKQQWMKDKVERGYWERQTQTCLCNQQDFKEGIGILMEDFNQTGVTSFGEPPADCFLILFFFKIPGGLIPDCRETHLPSLNPVRTGPGQSEWTETASNF